MEIRWQSLDLQLRLELEAYERGYVYVGGHSFLALYVSMKFLVGFIWLFLPTYEFPFEKET